MTDTPPPFEYFWRRRINIKTGYLETLEMFKVVHGGYITDHWGEYREWVYKLDTERTPRVKNFSTQ